MPNAALPASRRRIDPSFAGEGDAVAASTGCCERVLPGRSATHLVRTEVTDRMLISEVPRCSRTTIQ
jgi:hypothetical protein